MTESTYLIAKTACKKCGGVWRYKDRSCVGCKKRRSSEQYTEKLNEQGKTRAVKVWSNAFKAGDIYYQSNQSCKSCGKTLRYVSSRECVACSLESSSQRWESTRSLIKAPSRAILFQQMQEAENKEEWLKRSLNSFPRQALMIEKIYKNQGSKEWLRHYNKQKTYYDFEYSEFYKRYEVAKTLYDRAPHQPLYKKRLKIAEYLLSKLTYFHSHEKFPSKFDVFDPEIDSPETMLEEICDYENALKKAGCI
ncbi:hypothetical protein C2869_16305 [Saccharobesus litoralis]|uniref:Uncharacterized protein n=1 Tax=Saccharobesus litoralis TaxID=2172099 RepID=A0A2S0VUW8_9ALTE|nr:hypothetical protein [Saccharobesus litoralis]AWB67890.1 hypothetical protein C2869_16305 [Saccharobesus litoralis]